MKTLNARRQGDQKKKPQKKDGLNGSSWNPFAVDGVKFFGVGPSLTGPTGGRLDGPVNGKAKKKDEPKRDDDGASKAAPWGRYDVMEDWQDTRHMW